MIQKVTALYGMGISSTQYDMPVAMQWQGKTYYGVQQRTAVSVTALAHKLAPPVEPTKPRVPWIRFVAPFIPYVNFVLVRFAPISSRLRLIFALLFGATVLVLGVVPNLLTEAWTSQIQKKGGMVVEWASEHREELLVLWERACNGQPLYKLPPLK